MKVKVVSDVHVEFQKDHGRRFLRELKDDGVDVLVIAGDFGVANIENSLADGIATASYTFKHVVHVSGNHEYYHGSPEIVRSELDRMRQRYKNFHHLECETVVIEGQRFLGATLWFPEPSPLAPKLAMNDYHIIKDFEPWVYEEHARAVKFLTDNVQAGDVVVTHHIPTEAVVLPKWRDSRFSCFYASNSIPFEVLGRPRLWVYGHTHDSSEAYIGNTQFIANPYGYAGHEVNLKFSFDKSYEL